MGWSFGRSIGWSVVCYVVLLVVCLILLIPIIPYHYNLTSSGLGFECPHPK